MGKYVHLTPRMEAVARYVEAVGQNLTVADIGCDHGRLSAALLERNKSFSIIASDISVESVKKTCVLRDKCDLSQRMEVVQSDGLNGLDNKDADVIVIAGMGGILISDILQHGFDVALRAKRIVLQPMRGVKELRKYLHERGFALDDECLVQEDRRIYQILCVRFVGKQEVIPMCVPKEYYEIGHLMVERCDPLLGSLLKLHEGHIRSRVDKVQDYSSRERDLWELRCIKALQKYITSKIGD